MKKFIFILCLALVGWTSIFAQAPSYTDFEWDIFGIGIVAPVDESSIKGGLSLGSEVRYNLLDNLSFGLGGEINLFDLEELDNNQGEGTINASFTGFLSSDYYFSTTSPNRFFIGLAVGSNYNGDIEIEDEEEPIFIEGEEGMCLAPRVGFELGNVRFLGQYNIGLKEDLYDYVSVKVALTLWGGYKGGN